MNRMPPNVSALALFTIDMSRIEPTARSKPCVGHTKIGGAAILSHTISRSGKVKFRLRCKSLSADEPESALADWLEDELTLPGLVVAYSLYNTVLPLIQSLVVPGFHYSLTDLLASPRAGLEDLSRPPLSFTPAAFEDVCAQEWIAVVSADTDRDHRLWKASMTEHIDAIVKSRAIATWELWLSDFALSTGETGQCDHAAASLTAEMRLYPLPTADALGRPLPKA